MGILGALGQLYMFILLILIFLGLGLGTRAVLKSIFENEESKAKGVKKSPQKTIIKQNEEQKAFSNPK